MAARTTKPKPAPKPAAKKPPPPSGNAPAQAKAASKKAALKPAPQAKAKPAPRAKAKPAPQAKAKPAPQAKAKPAPQAKAKPAPQAKAKPAPQAKAKPAPQAKAKPAPQAKARPAPQTAPAPLKKATKSGAAREALKELAMKRAIAEVINPVESGSAVVDAYMRDVDHPFKAELEALRSIILGASSKIAERIKWNAPNFFYKEDLAAFHPRATEYAHLILLFPGGIGIPAKSALLEGKQKERREAKFFSLADIETKKAALQKLVRDWVALRDA